MTLKFRAGPTLFRYSAMLSALRQISKQKMTISSTKLKIRKTVGLKKTHTHAHTLWTAVSKRCGSVQRIHWFLVDRRPIRVKKKVAVSKIPGCVWTGVSFPRGSLSSDDGNDNVKNASGYLSKCIKTGSIRELSNFNLQKPCTRII